MDELLDAHELLDGSQQSLHRMQHIITELEELLHERGRRESEYRHERDRRDFRFAISFGVCCLVTGLGLGFAAARAQTGAQVLVLLAAPIAGVLLSNRIFASVARLRAFKDRAASQPRIQLPPGAWLARLAQLGFSRETYEDVFEQTLSDLQSEYFEALAQGDCWRARWARVRNTWAFWHAVVYQVADIWKDPS